MEINCNKIGEPHFQLFNHHYSIFLFFNIYIMKRADFEDFFNRNDLHAFDGLIRITLTDRTAYRAVWVTSTPELNPSVDHTFKGLGEQELFYLFDENRFVVLPVNEIDDVELIQQNYLKKPYRNYESAEEGKKHYQRLAAQNSWISEEEVREFLKDEEDKQNG